MATKYLSGNRLQGTAAERTALNLSSPPATSWKELGRTTLTSTNDSIDVSSFAAKDNLMILCNVINSGGDFRTFWRFNSDTNSNYSQRYNTNGGSDSTNTSLNGTMDWNTAESVQSFEVLNITNIASQEKLGIKRKIGSNTAGAGNAPNRAEIVGKWANTSNQITSVSVGDAVDPKSGTGGIGSEVVVLGCDNDEADSGTNFWQELADVELSSAGDTLNSGIFTAKKYLWVQIFGIASSNLDNVKIRFNNYSDSSYAYRHNSNGGSESTNTSDSGFNYVGTNAAHNHYVNMFVVNKSDKEKLAIIEQVRTDTGASNTPTRKEVVGKWAKTDQQIVRVTAVNGGSGDFASGSYIKVWGAN